MLNRFFPKSSNRFAKALVPSPGFSFQAQGITCAQFAEEVKLISRKNRRLDDRRICETLWVHPPTGLEAEVEYVYYGDTNVLEISGEICNRGRKVIKHVHGPIPLSFSLNVPLNGSPRTTTVYGGAPTEGDYPPKGYAVSETDGVRIMEGGREGGLINRH